MSYIRWIPASPGPGRSAWRLFPWLVAAAMTVVVVVNAGMIYAALASFPGKAGNEGFELSNQYDAVLDHAQQATELGWRITAVEGKSRTAEVVLTDRSGAPLAGATVTAAAERPLGERDVQRLAFREATAGHYIADKTLPLPGQWELTLSATADGHAMAATRRVFVH